MQARPAGPAAIGRRGSSALMIGLAGAGRPDNPRRWAFPMTALRVHRRPGSLLSGWPSGPGATAVAAIRCVPQSIPWRLAPIFRPIYSPVPTIDLLDIVVKV